MSVSWNASLIELNSTKGKGKEAYSITRHTRCKELAHSCYAVTGFREIRAHVYTNTSANADGPRDAASRVIDHIALRSKYNYQATSVGRKQIATQRIVRYYHIFER